MIKDKSLVHVVTEAIDRADREAIKYTLISAPIIALIAIILLMITENSIVIVSGITLCGNLLGFVMGKYINYVENKRTLKKHKKKLNAT